MSKILIKFPTRSRHDKFHSVLQTYIDMATSIENIQIIVSVDEDDEPEKYKKIHDCVTIVIGKHSNKIDAINRDMPDSSEFDIVLVASDDMIPIQKGYDDIIRSKMSQYFPDGDGVLFFNDGYTKYKLNTLVICGSKYYSRFGYIYFPEYKSFFCDNEFMDEANKLGRQIYIHDVIIRHEHPINVSAKHTFFLSKRIMNQQDKLYKINETYSHTDWLLYETRKLKQFDLSVLICTIPSRIHMFITLLNKLHTLQRNTKLLVEILFDDNEKNTIGEKRNNLVSRAKGKYCCFIDDDDDVTDEYFSVIEDSGLQYDCIQLNGKMRVDGLEYLPFYNSKKYTKWSQDTKGYYRSPTHLNPIKTSIVKQITFPDQNYFEDSDFSQTLLNHGLIHTEYEHEKIQYIYFHVTSKPVPKIIPKITLRGFVR